MAMVEVWENVLNSLIKKNTNFEIVLKSFVFRR